MPCFAKSAIACRRELRDSDTVARLGGDEFAVMLPGVGQTGAELAARKLIAAVQEPLHDRRAQPRCARQRGHRDRAGARHRGRSARAAGGRRDVRRQGRSIGLRRLRARARPPQPGTSRVDGRFPARDLARRASRRLSAEDQPENPRDFRRRGAGAMAASAARAHPAGSIHPDGRTDGGRAASHAVDARARAAAVPRVAAAWDTT